ncbi:MAG: FAD-binding oxidoreductase [Haloferacaceae archaeon]
MSDARTDRRHEYGFLDDLDLSGATSFDETYRTDHSEDYGTPPSEDRRPDVVVWPATTADVSAVLAACDERGVPVTPYAAGSGLEGGSVPTSGGVSLDLTRMDGIVDVRPEDLQVDVQAGVVGGDLNERLGDHGLFFPPLPSSGEFSTIGGMIATDASGMKTVKYGEVADWVLELEAVLADGTVVELGSKAIKTSSGYNLKDVVIGSEGTLAVVTRATLRLAGIPEQKVAGRAVFPDLDAATSAVADAVTAGVDVATIELIDEVSAAMANDYAGLDLPDAPMTFVEFHADHGVEEEVEFCRTIFEAHGVERFETSSDEREMADLWQARKDLAYAADEWDEDLERHKFGDVTVPISRYADLIREVKAIADEHGFVAPCFGHAGDGNLHYTVMLDTDDPDAEAVADEVYAEVCRRALDLGGTVTGEHGIGEGKRKFMRAEHGAAVDLMRRVKHAFDPNGTLNPGKVLPEED